MNVTLLPNYTGNPELCSYAGLQNFGESFNYFYWFFPSPNADTLPEVPIVVLLNDFGTSSLSMLMLENGPISFNAETLQLSSRNSSWSDYMHLLYIDVPIGVGFSYG